MIYHTIFAHIHDSEVKDISVGEFYEANEIAKMQYGDDAFAVEVTQYPVEIGDKFIDGYFKREVNGEMTIIDRIPTAEEEVQALKSENAELREQLDDLAMAFLESTEEVE